jgi:hypothetical protein
MAAFANGILINSTMFRVKSSVLIETSHLLRDNDLFICFSFKLIDSFLRSLAKKPETRKNYQRNFVVVGNLLLSAGRGASKFQFFHSIHSAVFFILQ